MTAGAREPAAAPISVARTSLALFPLQTCLRGSEALLPLLLAAWFGRSATTDLLYLTWAVYTLVGSILSGLFRDSAIVPILCAVQRGGPAVLGRVLGAVLGHTLVLSGGLSVLFAAAVVLALGRHWPGGVGGFAIGLGLPFALALVGLGVRSFCEAALQAERRFVLGPLGGAVGMAAALAVMTLARHRFGVMAVPWALACGELVAIAFVARQLLLRRRLVLSLRRLPAVREFGRRALAETAGGVLTRMNPLVDQAMALGAGLVGGGTLLRLSGDVAGVPTSLLQASLLPVLLARLSYDALSETTPRAAHRRTVVHTLAATAALLGAAALLLALVRRPLATLLFRHGAMDAASVAALAALLPYHLAGVVPFGLLLVLARAHVSAGNSRIMVSMGLLNCLANLLLNVLLLPRLGLRGLALSTSLVSLVVASVFWVRLSRLYAASDGFRAAQRVAA